MLNQRTRIILALLVIIALTFTILDLRGGKGPFSSVRSVVSSALGGVQVAASVIVSPITGVGSWWGTWGDQRARIAELESKAVAAQPAASGFLGNAPKIGPWGAPAGAAARRGAPP